MHKASNKRRPTTRRASISARCIMIWLPLLPYRREPDVSLSHRRPKVRCRWWKYPYHDSHGSGGQRVPPERRAPPPRPREIALSPLSSSKSGDRRDDRPAASSPEPADTSRRLWPHPGRVRSTWAAILTTDRLAATTAAATAAQRLEPRSRDFASFLLPFNESTAKRRRKGTPRLLSVILEAYS